MAIPITTQLFDAFLGTQEGIHSIILPDIFSSGGSTNLFIDKYARTKKISGYTKQNASAVTTDTGGSATLVRALWQYRSTGGGSITRQLLGVFDDGVNEWELWKSTDNGATWTFVSDFGSTVIGIVPDFAQFGDNLYITSGKVAPKVWNGTTLAAAGQTQSPTPSSAAGAAGQLTGNYNWKLVSVLNDGTRKAGSVATTALSLQAKQGSLSWTADANTSVVGYEVYRTSGTGTVYYYTDYVDGRTTAAYTDNIADLTILENRVMAEHGDPPPTCYFAEPHKQRMWWGKTDTYPTRVYWSDPGLADEVLGDNFLDFSDSETIGDSITGMIGNMEGRLVVFTERAVWTVSGTGQVIGNIVDWTRIRTNCQIGCVHHRAAARVPAGAKYSDQEGKMQLTSVTTLAYLTPLNDIRLFDGDNDVIISNPVKTTLSDLNYASRGKSHCLHDGQRGEVAWMFPSGSNGEPDQAVVWNYRWGVWYKRSWGFSSAAAVETSSSALLLLGGANATSTGGYVYQLWNGNSFDGSAITATWMTKALYGNQLINYAGQPAMSQRKRFRWVDFLFETEQTASLLVEWLSGGAPDNGAALGSVTISPAASSILTADGDTLVSFDGDTLVVSLQSTLLRAILQDTNGKYLHDEGIRLRVGDAASNGSWSIEAMNLAYQILPGLQRRMG